ncbi:MAG: MotA/TolQ/ExbB proton channel family protein [Leptospiraceae bacterium]|nr:MotA/TolQ/ExbB proton channel family protein [Leptospiraceae bacterium]
MKFNRVTVKSLTYSLVLIGTMYIVVPSVFSQTKEPQTTPAATDAKAPTDVKAPDANAPAQPEAKKEETVAPPKKSPGLIDLFIVGGWSMWPLLLSSIIGFGVALERLYFFFTNKLLIKGFNQDLAEKMEDGGLEAAKKFIEESKTHKIGQIIDNAMEISSGDPDIFSKGIEREAAETIVTLEKGLVILASVSTIAPLIGFLGTVSGMINAFDAIANADQVNAKVVAGGIKEALITTAAGLIVALPAMAFYQYLTGRVNAFASEVEEGANKIYKEFLRIQGKAVAGK